MHHAAKAGTPTMGGLCLSVAAPVGYGAGLVALGRGPSLEGLALVVCIVAGGMVGALDDWLEVRRGRVSLGLRELQKPFGCSGWPLSTTTSSSCGRKPVSRPASGSSSAIATSIAGAVFYADALRVLP